jgi:hypothetical protein
MVRASAVHNKITGIRGEHNHSPQNPEMINFSQ